MATPGSPAGTRLAPPTPAQVHRRRVAALVGAVALLGVVALLVAALDRPSARRPTLRNRIVTIASSQLGYRTDPSTTYCNRFSAYWGTGAKNCGNANRRQQWCADFAAWAWHQAGAVVVYKFKPGDLNSASASFYVWGVDHDTWHPVSSHYTPRPGDVAVYGLNKKTVTAQHVAIVTSFTPGDRGPNVINGDGSRTGHSVVERGTDQYTADVHHRAPLSGYVSPSAPGST